MRLAWASLAMVAADPAAGQVLPAGFVYLADIDASIAQDLRYARSGNFTGKPVPGYRTPECVLEQRTASALAAVQARLKPEGFGLQVYDCYRPHRATAAFMRWVRQSTASATSRYHPAIPRSKLIELGYIADRSSHSTGASVDLTLVRLTPSGTANAPSADSGCGTRPDGSIDMGSGFDCFDPLSHSGSRRLTRGQAAARSTLAKAMAAKGFRGYSREWWHFTFTGASTGPVEDFVVPPRPSR
jgi:D-alanyl-D-alanine dipeptidase